MGYRVLLVSAKTGLGIDRLRRRLAGRASVVAGQSGVGKSSLLNAIDPALRSARARGQRREPKGTHTTTTARLLPLAERRLRRRYARHSPVPAVGRDSRGSRRLLSRLATVRQPLPVSRIARTRTRRDCAVKDAVADGRLDARRYESYCHLFAGRFGLSELAAPSWSACSLHRSQLASGQRLPHATARSTCRALSQAQWRIARTVTEMNRTRERRPAKRRFWSACCCPSTKSTGDPLDELTGLAETAGARSRRPADPAPRGARRDHLSRQGQGRRAARRWPQRDDADVILFDNDLSPGPDAQPGTGHRRQGARSHRVDPRHLRQPRADRTKPAWPSNWRSCNTRCRG